MPLVAQMIRESACKVGDPGSIPGTGRSPGEGNGNPLQYSCLENFMDRGAWRVACSPWGGKESDTTNTFTFRSFYIPLYNIVIVQLLSHVWLFATHGLHHDRLPCSSPSPRACSNSCPLSQWCHPTDSSSVDPFSSSFILSQHQVLF